MSAGRIGKKDSPNWYYGFHRDFSLADRTWRIEVAPTPAFLIRHHDTGYRWIPVAGGLPPLTVAINLAARHFRLPSLADRIRGLLESYGLPPWVLELELTESTLLESGAQTEETLRALERLGVGLAIDDFGTGYSNLSYLKRLPLTALKIDRSFVRDLVTDPDDRILAATIVALGHQMELVVVAEGVETEDQRRILLEQGSDLAQGYLFGHPLPAEAFAEWRARYLAGTV